MDESQTLRSMVRDDAYQVIRVLADGPSGKTELVTLDGEGPLVRKSIPLAIANAAAWAAAMDIDEPLLPHIESLYRLPDKLVVVYDYVEGQSAAEAVEAAGPLIPADAANVVCDVCRAVSALHERGVVHRDITPSNVILASDGAHLVDLGIARQHVQQRNRDTTTLGTWGFASPEQFGFAQTDARSDVYSLGRLLGFLLTGFKPDTVEYEDALGNKRLVDETLAEVVRRATTFEPSKRYQSAQELADALQAALSAAQVNPVVLQGITSSSGDLEHPESVEIYRYSLRTEPIPSEDAGAYRYRQSVNQEVSTEANPPRQTRSAEPLQLTSMPADATSAAAASHQTPRAFADAPIVLKVAVITYWVVLGLLALIVIIGTIDIFITGEPADFGRPQYLMSVILVADVFVLAREAFLAVTLAGDYAKQVSPWKLFVHRSFMDMLLALVLMFVVALIFPS